MKGKEKRISILAVVLLLVVGGIMAGLQKTTYQFSKVPKPVKGETTDLSDKAVVAGADFIPHASQSNTGVTNYRDKQLLVDEHFTSNLPLIVIDTGEQKPERGVVWDKEKQCYVLTGEDPYAYGEIFVIDNQNGTNQIKDDAATQSLCKVKIRGNSSGNYDKKQYLIKLLNEKGKPNKENILNMGSDNEWILNISFVDKSLLRNYLGYTISGMIMPYTPDVQFCEVLWKDESGYRYEGVYLMMESVKVGKNRVDLPRYAENSHTTPALLRRDRYSATSIMLENYAAVNGFTDMDIRVEYPDQEAISEKGIQNITNQVNRFEQALYADSWEEFVQYREYVDMQSFIDYFIINEFFINYDAGVHSTNMYMNYSGKISMGPVWDFDQGVDNAVDMPAYLQSTALETAPWFDQIFKDPMLTAELVERYAKLRESILSDEYIRSVVEEAIDYLGPAIDRDWARWGYYYIDGDYLHENQSVDGDRNTGTHLEEVDRILSVLSQHGAWMDKHLEGLYRFKMISLEDAEGLYEEEQKDYGPALAVVFLAAFLISIKLVLRYESE